MRQSVLCPVQLWAQEMRPDAFVMVMGYGECPRLRSYD